MFCCVLLCAGTELTVDFFGNQSNTFFDFFQWNKRESESKASPVRIQKKFFPISMRTPLVRNRSLNTVASKPGGPVNQNEVPPRVLVR